MEKDAIVITDLYTPIILSRKVMNPKNIPEEEQERLLPIYTKKLLSKGYPVYLIENKNIPNYYYNREQLFDNSVYIHTTEIRKEPRIIKLVVSKKANR